MVKLTYWVKNEQLMIFITCGFKQDFLDICIGSLPEEICAKRKFNTARSQDRMGQLEGDVRFFNADIDDPDIQFFILKKNNGGNRIWP